MRIFILFCLVTFTAAGLRSDDNVARELELAVSRYEDAIADSTKKIRSKYETLIEKAQGKGDLAELKRLKSEFDTFKDTGVLSGSMANRAYKREIGIATARLETAYEDSIRSYTRDGRIAEAEIINRELMSIRKNGFTGQLRIPVGRWVSPMPRKDQLDGWAITRSGSGRMDATYSFKDTLLKLNDCSILHADEFPNLAIKASVKKVTRNSNFGFKLRCSTNDDGYTAFVDGNNAIGIGKKSNGTWRVLETRRIALSGNEFFEFAFAVHGSELRVYVDGEIKLKTRDQDLRTGGIGMMAYKSSALFQHVQIQRLPDSLPETWKP